MAFDPLTAGIITGVGGLASIIGGFISGEYQEDMLDKQLDVKNRQIDIQIEQFAQQMGLSKDKMKQQWNQFVKTLKQRKDEFSATHGLAKEQFGLQKEAFGHKKFMDTINPIIQKHRRAKNVLQAFSTIAKGNAVQRPAAATVRPTAAPAPAANPITQGAV